MPDMQGKTVVLTGGNSGIGFEAACALAGMGATVTITARDETKGADAVRRIRDRSGSADVEVLALDLASFESIRACAQAILDRHDAIDVLVNNAGGILSERQVTEEGFELTFGGNHLGHFLLTDLLRERLVGSAPSRVVSVASLAHRMAVGGMDWSDLQAERKYSATMAYNRSKLANVLFTIELARRLDGTGVTANCLHPGPVRTGFGSSDDTRGVERVGILIGRPFMITARRGSDPIVKLASDPGLADVSGRYFSRQPMSVLPVPIAAHRVARRADVDSARRLWEVSERLVAEAG